MAKGIPSKRKRWAKHGKHAGTKNLGLQLERLRVKRPRPRLQEPSEFFGRRKPN